jgi:hypothetical protein
VSVSKTKQRPLQLVAAAITVSAGSLALAACSSGPSSATSGGAAAAAKTPSALCQQILAVLSDGPDSGADPVGYALSQIMPLQAIHSSDTSVMHTVSQLVSADQAFYNSNGTDKSAATAIKKADASLNKACPGVAS